MASSLLYLPPLHAHTRRSVYTTDYGCPTAGANRSSRLNRSVDGVRAAWTCGVKPALENRTTCASGATLGSMARRRCNAWSTSKPIGLLLHFASTANTTVA